MKNKSKIFEIGPLKIKVNHFACIKCKIFLIFSDEIKGVKCPKCDKDMMREI